MKGVLHMSDYRRFVSYLYCYDNGIKKNNIGYARVETRNGQCKITIHIKLLSLSSTTLNTYLFYRRDNRIIGLPLCPLPVKNSVGDCQTLISSDKVLDSGIPFSMISGIIISVSPTRLLGTEWDDLPIIPSIFEPEAEEAKEPVEKKLQAADLEENSPASKENPAAAAEAQTSESSTPVETENAETTIAIEVEDSENTTAAKTEYSEAPIKGTESVPPYLNTITNYLLIDPAYIDHLSAEYAHLKQNSFVLHGYESYRHLILAKWLVSSQVAAAEASAEPDITDFDVFYQLGIPGIYSEREKAIAQKFGFLEFKTTKGSPFSYGDFGYWLIPVTF